MPSALAVFACRPNSHPFQERHVYLDEPVKIGRSVARCRPAQNNATFDCKVLSRNHALVWFDHKTGKVRGHDLFPNHCVSHWTKVSSIMLLSCYQHEIRSDQILLVKPTPLKHTAGVSPFLAVAGEARGYCIIPMENRKYF